MDNFDPYNVLLSIATNIPVLLLCSRVTDICFMIENITALLLMQFAVTERVWVDNVKLRTVFLHASTIIKD